METQPTDVAAMSAVTMAVLGLLGLSLLVSLICGIKVLIALFKKEGAGLGILGLVCTIYLYIWGWMKSRELALKKTMIVWTLAFLASGVLGGVAVVTGATAFIMSPEMQKAIKEGQEAAAEAQRQAAQPTPPPQN